MYIYYEGTKREYRGENFLGLQLLCVGVALVHAQHTRIPLSLRICCKFAHFLISTIAKEILN